MRKKLIDVDVLVEETDGFEEKSEEELQLDALIPRFGVNKKQLDELKKTTDRQSAEIKSIMSNSGIKNYTVGDYKVTMNVQQRESLDELQMMEYLKNDWDITCKRYGIIKTKEYIDMDALENAIYNDAFGEYLSNFDKYRNVKEVTTLRISKVKK